jgi:hypothetical protein
MRAKARCLWPFLAFRRGHEQNVAVSTSRSFALGCRAAPAVASWAYSLVRSARVCPGV